MILTIYIDIPVTLHRGVTLIDLIFKAYDSNYIVTFTTCVFTNVMSVSALTTQRMLKTIWSTGFLLQ